ncbi:Extracellular exo-inulinase inuE [Penicillium hispanicum]|uniref:Extracellular exo-inulinase inuE n=1 Tax=Penicillium hispanicum TaxID=1080232 RepID=UPI00253FCD91|nr:Extracellular exo-inulinase inuE [Penicillium hispanicum]KAJ5574128.1 Extracellular exo-inulinase inuE [Penicillium hispanicum]
MLRPPLLTLGLLAGSTWAVNYTEPYRPQYHFSPARNWMNDPAGLVYHDGTYHLFFQYNPGGIEWGNMSWGHATSNDLTHWNEQDIALLARGYPGTVTEMFFTGSAVADTNNTSGFGANGQVPLVAMYTSYYPSNQTLPSGKQIRTDQQSQSIAYSLDQGMTWTTLDAENPIILNPPAPYQDQYQNFRDPFVFWHEPTRKWVLVTSLAEIHKLVIWTSDNLRDWSVVSEFGPVNAVGGVWECPNLFALPVDGDATRSKWVMVVGLNPGGPPGTVGSGTQYFIGDFNGTAFVPDPTSIYSANTTDKWLDWGPDYYAAAGYNGLPEDAHVQLGWMNNWQYGQKIPTDPWRSAMATPRHLSLKTIDQQITLLQQPQENWKSIRKGKRESYSWPSFEQGTKDLGSQGKTLDLDLTFAARDASSSATSEFGIIVQSTADGSQQTRVGYDFAKRQVFVDRRQSGQDAFDTTFANEYRANMTAGLDGTLHLRILVDWSSVEVFGGEGETTLTAQIFPSEDATYARLYSTGGNTADVTLEIQQLGSIWE